jgi:hypothetical protein
MSIGEVEAKLGGGKNEGPSDHFRPPVRIKGIRIELLMQEIQTTPRLSETRSAIHPFSEGLSPLPAKH